MALALDTDGELQDLLGRLARFFSANESRISGAQVSRCWKHLDAFETSALNRLFLLLYQAEVRLPDKNGPPTISSAHGSGYAGHAQNQQPPDTPAPGRDQEHWPHGSDNLSRPNQDHSEGLQAIASSAYMSLQNCCRSCDTAEAFMANETDDRGIPSFSFTEPAALCRQRGPHAAIDLPALGIATVRQANATAPARLDTGFDDMAFNKTRLATCDEIKLSPSTEGLLKSCRTNPGLFILTIQEAKAVLPTGQGWEAAIATKKDNADIRDLMKIYHRFECYNIYKHVVEAGFHTGAHWIRDMRPELAKRLCRDFPERFQNQKAANKCLNWVDQGCMYHQWTKMFSDISTFGCLIALPSDVPHSAYTSRCSKTQMRAAVIKFRSLGISELVKDLELSKLGDYIVARLREMTAKKRTEGEVPSTLGTVTVQPCQSITPPEPTLATANDDYEMLFGDANYCLAQGLAQEHTGDWSATDSTASYFMASDEPLSNYEPSSTNSALLQSEVSVLASPIDEYRHRYPNEMEA